MATAGGRRQEEARAKARAKEKLQQGGGWSQRERVVGESEGQAQRKEDEGGRCAQGSGEVKVRSKVADGNGPESIGLRGDLRDFEKLCAGGVSLQLSGCLLAWLVIRGEEDSLSLGKLTALAVVLPRMGAGNRAVHRASRKALFPIRLGELDKLSRAMSRASYEEVVSDSFRATWHGSFFPCSLLIGCMGITASLLVAGGNPTRQQL